jgi:flagellar L-ring protein precursor FlgH
MNVVLSPLNVIACDAALEGRGLEEEGQATAYLSLPLSLPVSAIDWALPFPSRDAMSAVPGRMTMSARAAAGRGTGDGRGTTTRGGAGYAGAGYVGALLILLVSSTLLAQAPITPLATNARVASKSDTNAKPLSSGGDPAAASLEAYLMRVRLDNKAVQAAPGAIWTDAGRLTRMSTDVRAMRPHDLISVVVSENLAASTDGTVKNSRASNASSGISGLIGTLHAGNALQNLVNQNSTAGLTAQGASATNSSLTTTLGGQVVEVLPNGMLVIEAARQVEFSQQMQTIVLRGLVRPEDISQENQVLSTAISSLEVQVRGKGIINDYTRRQNALVRLIQRVLVF